ncbi:MAG: amidohydrolase family protein [Acidimicrobiales bacterium]
MGDRIDVHAHYLPPAYRQALIDTGHEQPDGFPILPEWSPAEHVAAMDRLGIDRSLLSVSSPGVHLDGGVAETVDRCRAVNLEGRAAVADHPDRFGLLASLPLPDIDAALAEVAVADDDLDADGFVLMTNVGGRYLADEAFAPLWRALDDRAALVLLHPTSPVCWHQTSLGRPRPMLEFLFDTTRAVVDLVLGGVLRRHAGVRVVVPHAGAVLPIVAERVAAFARFLAPDEDVARTLGRLHYDLAGHVTPESLAALRSIADVGHLHYGSDYPFTPEPVAAAAHERLDAVDPDLLASLGANTRRLLEP